MNINEQTAQLILDAISWCNSDWMDALGWNYNEGDKVSIARGDFVRFCNARGIDRIERTITIKEVIKDENW